MSDLTLVVKGHGRQKVFPAVGRCIYCFATDCDLGDEHIIPQALGGNMILPQSCCRKCECIIGAKLEGSLMNKRTGMFAALRLRSGFKSKRPKERPASLPFTITGRDGAQREIEIPAKDVPRNWTTFITELPPGVLVGRSRHEAINATILSQFDQNDVHGVIAPGESIALKGSATSSQIERFLAKIAHGMAVAHYGFESFEPWLPDFILGKEDCALGYFVAGWPNDKPDEVGDHKITVGSWNDGTLVGAGIRLFCLHGTPEYDIVVGKFKEPGQQ